VKKVTILRSEDELFVEEPYEDGSGDASEDGLEDESEDGLAEDKARDSNIHFC
jgi:hypothetical protein